MAPGYLIAALCECAGLLGLLTVVAMNRAARRTKASELRGVLWTGQPAAAMAGPGAGRRQRVIPVRASRLPAMPSQPRDSARLESAARSALRRAILKPA